MLFRDPIISIKFWLYKLKEEKKQSFSLKELELSSKKKYITESKLGGFLYSLF